MAEANGAKFQSGANAWLKQNWLLLTLIVGATAGWVRMEMRMSQLCDEMGELRTLMTISSKLSAIESKQEGKFQRGVLQYMDRDLRYHFPHYKEKK